MGGLIACIGCYCCLLTLKPKYVELIGLLANVVEIGFLIWGIAGIPWSDINTGSKVCFFITCGLVLITLIILVILMILRCNNTINNSRNSTGKCLCIAGLIIDILAFIMIIITEAIILYKMYDLDYNGGYRNGRYYGRNGYFSGAEWAAAVISTSATEIGIMVHTYCISFLMKLIHLRTDLSYYEYNKNLPSNRDSSNNDGNLATTVNVYPVPPNNNNLSFLGYDKDGRPIYAGNDQYRTINAPVINQPNAYQNNTNNRNTNNINQNINTNNINNNNINHNDNTNNTNNINNTTDPNNTNSNIINDTDDNIR